MFTPFSQGNQDFSDKAHAAAQSLVYPHLFCCDRELMSFDRTSVSDGGEKAILDGQMAVDRIVHVSVSGLRDTIDHIVQERFRRPQYARYRDITITEWNHATNQKSELYKLKAGIFLYGYFDEARACFGEVIAVNTASLMRAIAAKEIVFDTVGPDRNPRARQSFLCFKFESLIDAGVVMWHRKKHLQDQISKSWAAQFTNKSRQ